MSIIYIDRKGHKRQGETGQDRLLAFIYGHAVTRCLIRPFLSPVVSRIGGAFLDTRISGLAVPGFVKKNGIDLSYMRNGYLIHIMIFSLERSE